MVEFTSDCEEMIARLLISVTSSKSDSGFPTVGLEVPEGRNHLTGKTMAAFRYIYENHFNDADWFMKVSHSL